MTGTIVDAALRGAGIPIEGVSIGDVADRATWKVHFQASATPAQRTSAATIVATVAVDAAAEAADDRRICQMRVDLWPIEYRALVLALIDEINILRANLVTPLPPRTAIQAFNALKAKAATL